MEQENNHEAQQDAGDEQLLQQEFEQQGIQAQPPAEEEEQLEEQNQDEELPLNQEQDQQFIQQEEPAKSNTLVPPKPLTAFGIFMKSLSKSEGSKFDLKAYASTWSEMSQSEKRPFVEQALAMKQAYNSFILQNPQSAPKVELAFPNSRIRAIMRQDSEVVAKMSTVQTMNKATQFFGEYILKQINRNKASNKKKKVELADLWNVINFDRTLSFLRPLIDEKKSIESARIPDKSKNIAVAAPAPISAAKAEAEKGKPKVKLAKEPIAVDSKQLTLFQAFSKSSK